MYIKRDIKEKESMNWEKSQDSGRIDNTASEIASQTILENKNYIANIDRLIAKERDTA